MWHSPQMQKYNPNLTISACTGGSKQYLGPLPEIGAGHQLSPSCWLPTLPVRWLPACSVRAIVLGEAAADNVQGCAVTLEVPAHYEAHFPCIVCWCRAANSGSAHWGPSLLPPAVRALLTVITFPYISPLASPAHILAPGRLTFEMKSVKIDSTCPWDKFAHVIGFTYFSPVTRIIQPSRTGQLDRSSRKKFLFISLKGN